MASAFLLTMVMSTKKHGVTTSWIHCGASAGWACPFCIAVKKMWYKRLWCIMGSYWSHRYCPGCIDFKIVSSQMFAYSQIAIQDPFTAGWVNRSNVWFSSWSKDLVSSRAYIKCQNLEWITQEQDAVGFYCTGESYSNLTQSSGAHNVSLCWCGWHCWDLRLKCMGGAHLVFSILI